MTRTQRRWHWRMWLIFGMIAWNGFCLAVVFRPRIGNTPPPPRVEVSP